MSKTDDTSMVILDVSGVLAVWLPTGSLPENKWSHVVYSDGKWYVNGKLVEARPA